MIVFNHNHSVMLVIVLLAFFLVMLVIFVLARLLRAAGYHVATEVWETRWNKPQLDRHGQPKRDRRRNVHEERARLDLRLQAPPGEPLTYGDVVVGHPCAESWVRDAANVDGATAEVGVRRKLKRYPPEMLPSAKLVAFSVETWGRWAPGAVAFLKRAAGRAAQRSPGLASPDEGGANAVYAAWLRQLSCALQKGNVACLRGAASGQSSELRFGGASRRGRGRGSTRLARRANRRSDRAGGGCRGGGSWRGLMRRGEGDERRRGKGRKVWGREPGGGCETGWIRWS